MESQAQNYDSPVPPYEQWPSVPRGPLGNPSCDDEIAVAILADSTSKNRQALRATSTPSMDDIEAAQALEGLRADFKYSPQPRQPNALPSKVDPTLSGSQNPQEPPQQPEPLLSILTSQHPLLSTAVNRSLSAYFTSKSYSPSFKYGAEFVERHIGSPVVSTVETASRISGVETGVRWWLQRGNSNNSDRSKKRRRLDDIEGEHLDVERGLRDSKAQANIQESFSELTFTEPLPAYDDQRSPSYEEKQPMDDQNEVSRSRLREWQQRIIVYTSGLGVSLSEESLRSLRHCLEWLRWANQHINNNIRALHEVLDKNVASEQSDTSKSPRKGEQPNQTTSDRAGVSQYVDALDQSVRSILKEAIRVVNRFTGNALPDNARQLVRRYITSFPLSFRIVNTLFQQDPEFGFPGHRSGQSSETEARTRKAILFAREGLNMLVQITGVVDGTITSADQWVDRLERRGSEERDVDDVAMNVATENEMNETMADGAVNVITVDGTTLDETAGNENDVYGDLAIRTSGKLGMLKKEDGKPLKWVSEDAVPVSRPSASETPRNGEPRSNTPMTGASANGASINRSRTNDAPPRYSSMNGHLTNGDSAGGASTRGEQRPELNPRPRVRNPNIRPSPVEPTSETALNLTSENETLTNGDSTTYGNGVTERELPEHVILVQGYENNGPTQNLMNVDEYGHMPNNPYRALPNNQYGDVPNSPYRALPNSPYGDVPISPYRALPNSSLPNGIPPLETDPIRPTANMQLNNANAINENTARRQSGFVEPEDPETTGPENLDTSDSEDQEGE